MILKIKLLILFWLFSQSLLSLKSYACESAFKNHLKVVESARKGETDKIKTFLQTIDPNLSTQNKITLEETLKVATQKGHIEIIKYILNRGEILLPLFQEVSASFFKETKIQLTITPSLIKELLTEAVINNQVKVFKFYISLQGIGQKNIDPTLLKDLFKQAIRENKQDIVLFYLSKKGFGFISEGMLEAVFQHKSDMLNLFFKKIPEANKYLPESIIMDFIFSKKSMETLTTLSLSDSFKNTLKVLITNKVDPNKSDGDLFLHSLFRKKYKDVIKNISKQNLEFYSSLELQTAYLSVFKILHSLGANPYSRDKNNETLAHAAATGGHFKIIQELYNLGHDLNLKTNKGDTVWDLMKIHKHLISNDTSYNIYHNIGRQFILNQIKNKDKLEDHVLIDVLSHNLLTAQEFKDLLPKMIEKGVSPNAKSPEGMPALHLALKLPQSIKTRLQYAEILYKNNADINIKNEMGDSILHAELKDVIRDQFSKISVDLFIEVLKFFIDKNEYDREIKNKTGDSLKGALYNKLHFSRNRYRTIQIEIILQTIKKQEQLVDLRGAWWHN